MSHSAQRHVTNAAIHRSVRGHARAVDKGEPDPTFARYSDWVRRLDHYSIDSLVQIRNEWQVRRQGEPTLPELSYIADRSAWRLLGRHVRQRERGIPFHVPADALGAARYPEVATNEPRHPSQGVHRTAYVFDLSQTDGDPVPNWYRDMGMELGDLLPILLGLADTVGVEVTFGRLGKPNGVSTDGRISLNADRPASIQAQTLIHEITHQLLGHVGGDQSGYALPRRGVAEAEAEGVLVAVLAALGHDVTTTSAAYVRSNGGRGRDVRAGLPRITAAARTVLDWVLPRLPAPGIALAATTGIAVGALPVRPAA